MGCAWELGEISATRHFFCVCVFLTVHFADEHSAPSGLHFRRSHRSESQKSPLWAARVDSFQSKRAGNSFLLLLWLNTTKPQWFSFNIVPNHPTHILLLRLFRTASATASEGLVTCFVSADRAQQRARSKHHINTHNTPMETNGEAAQNIMQL